MTFRHVNQKSLNQSKCHLRSRDSLILEGSWKNRIFVLFRKHHMAVQTNRRHFVDLVLRVNNTENLWLKWENHFLKKCLKSHIYWHRGCLQITIVFYPDAAENTAAKFVTILNPPPVIIIVVIIAVIIMIGVVIIVVLVWICCDYLSDGRKLSFIGTKQWWEWLMRPCRKLTRAHTRTAFISDIWALTIMIQCVVWE